MSDGRPTPPLGSDTKIARAIGEGFANAMSKRVPKAAAIPPHRWAQKVSRFGQRLVFVALAVVAIKLNWPTWAITACVLAAVRALAPDLADSTVRWVISIVKEGKSARDGQ